MNRKLTADLLKSELTFTASRSSGPGGQNVNKVNSKVTLSFDISNSNILTAEEKELLLKKLARQTTAEGIVILSSQDKRSQLQNKEDVLLKLGTLLTKALAKRKQRKATKPSKGAMQNRLNKKKQHGEKKQWRRKPL